MKCLKVIYEDEAINYRYSDAISVGDVLKYATKAFELEGKYALQYKSLLGIRTIDNDEHLKLALQKMNK